LTSIYAYFSKKDNFFHLYQAILSVMLSTVEKR